MHVVITGANRGIGAELAAQYKAQGAHVTATSRQGAPFVPLDVTSPQSLRDFAKHITAPVDLVVCNAGVLFDRGENVETGYPAEMWSEMLATNVTGVFLTVQSLLPQLRAAQNAKVAIISSQLGSSTRAKGQEIIYRVSKAAAINLGLNLAQALRPDGIAVGIYHPGWVRTDMGGQEADINVEDSASGLVRCFAQLDLATSGRFLNWDGRPHPL